MKKITLLLFVMCMFTFNVHAQISETSSPDASIPDNDPMGLDDTITIAPTTGTVSDVTVQFEIYHTWVGDLIVTLTAPDGSTSTAIMDRPGVPGSSSIGCSANNINVLLTDAGSGSVEDQCDASEWEDGDPGAPTYAISGERTAHDGAAMVNLSTFFDGIDATGDWILNVSDNVNLDNGKLLSWTLNITGPSLGLEDNDLQAFEYSPNPVINSLKLKAVGTIEMVSVYNIIGQEVMRTYPNTFSNDLDMSALQSGTYFVKVDVEGNSKTVKIIKS